MDKYGAGQDPYCFPGGRILRNRLNIRSDALLEQAERNLSEIAAGQIEFSLPPYDLNCLRRIHRILFADLYNWAGALRTIDISKGETRFCSASRIVPESDKIFGAMAQCDWFEDWERSALVSAMAEHYGDLNMIHPFREGNGRAQRILFEHLIVHAGYEISWWPVDEAEWLSANVAAVVCDYKPLELVFQKCIGQRIGT